MSEQPQVTAIAPDRNFLQFFPEFALRFPIRLRNQ